MRPIVVRSLHIQSLRIRKSVPLSAVIGNNRIRQELDDPTYAIKKCSLYCYHNHQTPKEIVSTLTFELKTRLKLSVDEVGLLLRHFYGYSSVCFLKPATPLRLPARLN